VLLPVVRQCAETSLIFFGKVSNIGKSSDATLHSEEARQASSALTVIDTALQDIILSTVLQHFPFVRCIAEEDTPLRRRFSGNDSEYALILDPIDGTYHFQRGDAPYCVSVGLARNGFMEAAVVARPSEDKVFTAVLGHGSYVQIGRQRRRRLRLKARPTTRSAYFSTKARDFRPLAAPELEPREYPIGAALVLTQIAEGELCAYLTRQVQVYDAGPPSLIAEEAGARCFLHGGRTPTYDRQRKFGHFMSAATPELEAVLLDIVRRGTRRGST
jgi:myo-inositol-1(or 4)-monophosphatase